MVVRIQQRHDTTNNWLEADPILFPGEIGIETDGHQRMKIGNGVSKWSELPYFDREGVHTYGDEQVSGEKQFLDNIVVGSAESEETKANVTVNGDISVTGAIDGVISNAIADELGNNIVDYYQRKLANENTFIDNKTDWNTIVNEGIYGVNVDINYWNNTIGLNQPTAYNSNIHNTGILVNHVINTDNNILQIYYPNKFEKIPTKAQRVHTVVYRMFVKYENEEGFWTDWAPYSKEDNDVVHIDGDEYILGSKTFDNNVTFNSSTSFLENINLLNEKACIMLNDIKHLSKSADSELIISNENIPIHIRPNGADVQENQIVFNIDGTIDGKCIKDGKGNNIESTYLKKSEFDTNVLKNVLKEPVITPSIQDNETYNKILERKYSSAIPNDEIFEFINNPITLYAYACDIVLEETGDIEEKVIYADSPSLPTVLVDKYNVAYEGTDFVITEGIITYGDVQCERKEEYDVHYGLEIDEEGNVTGFGPNNYIKLKQLLNLNDDFEITFEFTTPEEMSIKEVVTGQDEDGNDIIEERFDRTMCILCSTYNQHIAFSIDKTTVIDTNVGDGTQWYCLSPTQYGTNRILPDTHYTYTLKRVGNKFSTQFITNTDDTVVTDWEFESDVNLGEHGLVIGTGRSVEESTAWFIDGSINIKSFSIKVVDEELIKRFDTELDKLKEHDYNIVEEELTLYKYSCSITNEETGESTTHEIYADSDVQPVALYNADKTLYKGDEFRIETVEDVTAINYIQIIETETEVEVEGGFETQITTEEVKTPLAIVEGATLVFENNLVVNEEGIARKFSNTNYITKDYTLPNNYEIVLHTKIIRDDVSQGIFKLEDNEGGKVVEVIYADDNIVVKGYENAIEECIIPCDFNKYIFIRIIKEENNVAIGYSLNYEDWDEQYFDIEGYELKTATKLVIGSTGKEYQALQGYMDLNHLHVAVDETVTYLPCLNIPFVPGNDGTKVVDYKYFYRVSDAVDLYKTANYFILDEEGEQFKLPYDSIYGYCRQLKQWRKGAESYEYDTNLECVQTGSMVAETPVVFKKPFADDNYYISVPYAEGSKTREGFTPTENGIYYTKGRVFLE